MGTLKEIKDLVQEAIDRGATTVEEVHREIAKTPLKVLESIAPDLPVTKIAGDVQQQTIGTVYEIIRVFNSAVGEAADELLKKIEPDE